MLTRALMLNPRPMQAPAARTLGRYLTKDGKLLDAMWDAAARRLSVRWLAKAGYGEVLTAVSSQGRVAFRMDDGRIGLYDVTASGLAATPATTFAYSSSPSSISATINGNGDSLFVKAATQTAPAEYTVRNQLTGQSRTTIAQMGYGGGSYVYNTGDGWLTQVAVVNGEAPGTQAWVVTSGSLTVRYPVFTGTVSCLSTIAAPNGGSSPLPLSGIPRVLGSSNKIFLVRILPALSDKSLNQTGGGTVAIPATVEVDEVNVDQDTYGTSVSYSKSSWYGYIVASMGGANFVPLSVYYFAKLDIPCTFTVTDNGEEVYYPTGINSFNAPAGGRQNLSVKGILPTAVYLSDEFVNSAGTPVTRWSRTVDPRDANIITDPSPLGFGWAVPHLGALVGLSGNQRAFSFDGGRTAVTGQLFQSQLPNGTPQNGAADLGLATATPLFLV